MILLIAHTAPSTIQQHAPTTTDVVSLSLPSLPSITPTLDALLRSDLEALRHTFFALLIFVTVIVALGVVLEEAEELMSSVHGLLPLDPMTKYRWTKKLVKFGWICIVVGVGGEGICEVLVSRIDNQLQEFNNILLAEAQREAGDAATSAKIAHDEANAVIGIANAAREDAKDALRKAQKAQRELAHAESDAAKAQLVSSTASDTAHKAEEHLSAAVKRADELTEQLKRLTTPRSLTSIAQVTASLAPFRGTQYMWDGVCSDVECVDLLRNIDAVLQQAGWKREKANNKFPSLNVSGIADSISVSLQVGIELTTEAPNADALIANQNIAKAPIHIQAAAVLNLSLAANVYPPENPDKTPAKLVHVSNGPSPVIRITVGRKVIP